MKKFDVKKAKDGFSVITQSGKSVEILKYNRNNSAFPIVAIIEDKQVVCYTIEGKYFKDKDSDKDLKLK